MYACVVADRRHELESAIRSALERVWREDDELACVEDIPAIEAVVGVLADDCVERARSAGASWAEIADRLGVSRQAVHKRYGPRTAKRRLELRVEFGRDSRSGR